MPALCDVSARSHAYLIVAAVVSLAVAHAPAAAESPSAQKVAIGSLQIGRASWYGAQHHGRETASGAVFDMHELTAAHPMLPFGSRVRVTNLHNGRFVDVRINDRGPVVRGRIIDLSYASARAVGAVGAGVFPVRIEILALPTMTTGR